MERGRIEIGIGNKTTPREAVVAAGKNKDGSLSYLWKKREGRRRGA